MSEHVSCRQCADFLDDYIAGTLDPVEAKRFEIHLDKCQPCRDFLDSYRETIRLGRACCCRGKTPPNIPEEVVQAILKAREGGRSGD